jgi:hypothetical protein
VTILDDQLVVVVVVAVVVVVVVNVKLEIYLVEIDFVEMISDQNDIFVGADHEINALN